jgi:hypothetical protein
MTGAKVDRIEGKFSTPISNGVLKLVWAAPLH